MCAVLDDLCRLTFGVAALTTIQRHVRSILCTQSLAALPTHPTHRLSSCSQKMISSGDLSPDDDAVDVDVLAMLPSVQVCYVGQLLRAQCWFSPSLVGFPTTAVPTCAWAKRHSRQSATRLLIGSDARSPSTHSGRKVRSPAPTTVHARRLPGPDWQSTDRVTTPQSRAAVYLHPDHLLRKNGCRTTIPVSKGRLVSHWWLVVSVSRGGERGNSNTNCSRSLLCFSLVDQRTGHPTRPLQDSASSQPRISSGTIRQSAR